jgi:manganese/zinc/iron transport system substrate-binding protein
MDERVVRVGLAALWAGLLAGCGGSDQVAELEEKPLVVTTVTMVTDLVAEVGGDRIVVDGLLGPAVDPHSYKPRLSDSSLLERADAVFYCGLHLEGKMHESLQRLGHRKGEVWAVADGVPKGKLLEPQKDFEGHYDPHIWGDPELWAHAIDVVVKGLSQIDPAGAEIYAQNGEVYRDKLMALKAWARQRVGVVPPERRLLITSHDAFLYFGRAFGFEVRGLQGVSTVSEAGLRDRDELVRLLRERGVPAIFPESSVNVKAIATVASEAGVSIGREELFSDAMGSPGDIVTIGGESYDKGTYIGMIKHNVNSVVEELKGS